MYYGKLLRQIAETLQTIAGSLPAQLSDVGKKIDDHAAAVRDASEAQNETWKELPAYLSELRIPADERTKADVYRKKAHRQQVWLTWGTWLAFIVASIYAGISGCQYSQMKIATDAASSSAKTAESTLKQAEAGNRPWIGFKGDTVRIDFRTSLHPEIPNYSPGAEVMISGVLRNFGPNPATKVYTSIGLTFAKNYGIPPSDPLSITSLKSQCLIAEPTPNTPNAFIFPANDFPFQTTTMTNFRFPMKDVRQVWIPVCIIYTDALGSLHHTKLLYASTEISGADKPIEKWVLYSEEAD
ncbi:MAG TPA: hypothetical protein VHZ52_09910 [Acidobacteriaceae bacterium]|jgi:hypothetical protein|nr:hypothetical protein [Acidobacteriaceae bacterium]